jgi:hypothetical protein
MRLHTDLPQTEVARALHCAKLKGYITADVELMAFSVHQSRTRPHGYEISLGTYDKHSLPPGYRDQRGKVMRVRKYANGGDVGASSEYYGREGARYAATWDEWGWFMAEIFCADADARFGPYKNSAHFHRLTENRYRLTVPDDAGLYRTPNHP